ncbi:MAG: FAD-linked oxidase C-terminal domain-containing protein [Hyphomicrobiaceae bacterium]
MAAHAHLPSRPAPPDPAALTAALSLLKQRFGERLETGAEMRRQHANTLTWIPSELPDAVVFAQSGEEVAEIVGICARHKVPIIPFGAGTSLEGQINAPAGGVSLDLSRMTRIIAVNEGDLDVTVEPGVTRTMLNEHLRDRGLFFPIDPGAGHATLAGMASTRASGTTAVRYGTMRENVLGLTLVMADGQVVRTARRARKSSAGYDLTRLVVGAEGTLGVITELTVRVYGIPESTLAAVCPFATLEGACNTVMQSIQLGLGLARIELLDELQIRACNIYSKLDLAETPTLFLEFHGTEAGTREQVETFRAIAEAEGALRFDWAERPEDRSRLWKARHDAYWATKVLRPGADLFATDVCVPISRLAECLAETKADLARTGLLAPIVGHVGDGNFHLVPLFDRSDAEEVARVEAFCERLVARALAFDGTCTGEHGVGEGKRKYLEAEHGPGLSVMAAIKRALDPDGIMNPGKILPAV